MSARTIRVLCVAVLSLGLALTSLLIAAPPYIGRIPDKNDPPAAPRQGKARDRKDAKQVYLVIELTPTEKKLLKGAATGEKMDTEAWARQILIKAAARRAKR